MSNKYKNIENLFRDRLKDNNDLASIEVKQSLFRRLDKWAFYRFIPNRFNIYYLSTSVILLFAVSYWSFINLDVQQLISKKDLQSQQINTTSTKDNAPLIISNETKPSSLTDKNQSSTQLVQNVAKTSEISNPSKKTEASGLNPRLSNTLIAKENSPLKTPSLTENSIKNDSFNQSKQENKENAINPKYNFNKNTSSNYSLNKETANQQENIECIEPLGFEKLITTNNAYKMPQTGISFLDKITSETKHNWFLDVFFAPSYSIWNNKKSPVNNEAEVSKEQGFTQITGIKLSKLISPKVTLNAGIQSKRMATDYNFTSTTIKQTPIQTTQQILVSTTQVVTVPVVTHAWVERKQWIEGNGHNGAGGHWIPGWESSINNRTDTITTTQLQEITVNSIKQDTITTTEKINNQYSYLEIPLSVSYQIPLHRFTIQFNAGIIPTIKLKNTGKEISNTNPNELTDINDIPYNNLLLSYQTSLKLSYNIYSYLSIYTEPFYSSNITSYTKNTNYQKHNTTFGNAIGLTLNL